MSAAEEEKEESEIDHTTLGSIMRSYIATLNDAIELHYDVNNQPEFGKIVARVGADCDTLNAMHIKLRHINDYLIAMNTRRAELKVVQAKSLEKLAEDDKL